MVRQPGQLERGAEPAAFAQADFFAEEQVDELEVAHGVGLGAGDAGSSRCSARCGRVEPGGVVADAGADQLVHAGPVRAAARVSAGREQDGVLAEVVDQPGDQLLGRGVPTSSAR